MGRRWVYFVVNIADYSLQQIYFGVKNVEFKIGAEIDLLNRTLSVLPVAKSALRLRNMDKLLPFSRALVGLTSLFGTSQGGVVVEVQGTSELGTCRMSLGLVAETRSEIIPAILPSIAAQMVLNGEMTSSGIVPLHEWLSRERFASELTKRDVKMWEKTGDQGTWALCS